MQYWNSNQLNENASFDVTKGLQDDAGVCRYIPTWKIFKHHRHKKICRFIEDDGLSVTEKASKPKLHLFEKRYNCNFP